MGEILAAARSFYLRASPGIMKVKSGRFRDCTGNLWDKRGGIRMFRVFMIIAWAVLLVLLLYLWADVREMAGTRKGDEEGASAQSS